MSVTQASEDLVRATVRLSDTEIAKPWAWGEYDKEGLRFTLLVAHRELRELAVRLAALRGPEAPTQADRILDQLHLAYRDVTGVVAGVGDADLDQQPAPGDWPIRKVLEHMMSAERGFLAAILLGLDASRAGLEPAPNTAEERKARVPVEPVEGGAAAVRDALSRSHRRVLAELASVSDEELDVLSHHWEEEAFPIRFRMHRFEAHLRQHQVQVEKTLAGIGHGPSEAERLVRLLHVALGDVEIQTATGPAADEQRLRGETIIRELAAEATRVR